MRVASMARMRLNFKRLGLLGSRAVRSEARRVDLTPSRLDFVTVLMHGPLCQRDIAARLCVTEPVVSRMVHALMERGFVVRVIPAADRRFRLVSLTDFGRFEYHRLTDCEWLLDPDARFGAQTLGEAHWYGDWEKALDTMGLGFLGAIFQFDYVGAWPVDTPFAGIRTHRNASYGDLLLGDYTFDEGWPWTVRVRPPPLQAGVRRDPLSDRYQAAWRLPRGSYFVPKPNLIPED